MKLYELTAALILIFAILLGLSSESEADPYVEVGALFESSDATMASIGYLYNDKWEASLSYIGEGEDDWGQDTPKVKIMAVTRLFHPGWVYNKYFMGIGLSKLESDEKYALVDTWNFKLVIGLKLGDRSRLYFQHYSSFDVNEQNTGINALVLRVDL